MAYAAHTRCDKNNFILSVEVTAGNVHDSIAFDKIYEKTIEKIQENQNGTNVK